MKDSYLEFVRYGSIGSTWVLVAGLYVFIGVYGGEWLDKELGSEPIFLVIGLVAAGAFSLASLVRRVMLIERLWHQEHQAGESEKEGNGLD